MTRHIALHRMNNLVWIGLTALLGAAVPAQALESNLPPGGNFDLSHWKITLPDATASETNSAQLVAGFTNALYFYTATDGAMTFWCPVNGGTTSGSSYPRSELRELLNTNNDNINWNSAIGIHTMDADRVHFSGPVHELVLGHG